MNKLEDVHLAAMFGQYDLLKKLLDSGVDPNTLSIFGKTPLHCLMGLGIPAELTDYSDVFAAPIASRIKVLQLLLERGGIIDARDPSGRTPLMSSIRCTVGENVELAKILLDHGADPLLQDKDGHTAFHHACDFKKSDVLALLLEYGPPIDQFPIGKDNRTLLHLIASSSKKLFKNSLPSTPVDFINSTCIYREGMILDEMLSLPCCLIQNRDLEGLEALLNCEGITTSVLTCPIVSELCRAVYSPVAFAFVKDTFSNFSFSIIQLFIDHNLPLDPDYSKVSNMSLKDTDIFTCLEILIDVHEFHMTKGDLKWSCKCARLFILLLEKGARVKPFMPISQDVISTPILKFICVHCSFFGLAFLLKHSLEPSIVLNAFISFFTSKKMCYVNPSNRAKIIRFLMSFCNPGDVLKVRDQLKKKNHPTAQGIVTSLSYESVTFPSLKCLSRCAVRKQCQVEVESLVCGTTLSSYLSQLPLPKSLISYLEFSDLISFINSHPHYPSFDIDISF